MNLMQSVRARTNYSRRLRACLSAAQTFSHVVRANGVICIGSRYTVGEHQKTRHPLACSEFINVTARRGAHAALKLFYAFEPHSV